MRLKRFNEINKDFDELNETKNTFSKKDLQNAFNAGKTNNFDTGVSKYDTFNQWYKKYIKK